MTFSNERLFDLIRYVRFDLHNEGLITDDEFAILAESHESVKRLESHDDLRAKLAERDKVITECRKLVKQFKQVRFGVIFDEKGNRIYSGNVSFLEQAAQLAAILPKEGK